MNHKMNNKQKLIVLATIIGLVTIFAWMLILKPGLDTHCLTALAFNVVAILFLGWNLFWVHRYEIGLYRIHGAMTIVSVAYAITTVIVTLVTFRCGLSKWSYTKFLMINFTILAIALIGYFIARVEDEDGD